MSVYLRDLQSVQHEKSPESQSLWPSTDPITICFPPIGCWDMTIFDIAIIKMWIYFPVIKKKEINIQVLGRFYCLVIAMLSGLKFDYTSIVHVYFRQCLLSVILSLTSPEFTYIRFDCRLKMYLHVYTTCGEADTMRRSCFILANISLLRGKLPLSSQLTFLFSVADYIILLCGQFPFLPWPHLLFDLLHSPLWPNFFFVAYFPSFMAFITFLHKDLKLSFRTSMLKTTINIDFSLNNFILKKKTCYVRIQLILFIISANFEVRWKHRLIQ